MRPLAGLIATALAPLCAELATADPRPAPGYAVEIVRQAGATFAGLAREGDGFLVTNLADGRLYRRGPDGRFTAFGPKLPHGIDVIGDPTGPYRVGAFGEKYLIAQGWTPVDAEPGPYDHALLEIDADGAVRVVHADFWNPYDFAVAGETIYVVDAARNSIERLTPDGDKTTLFTFLRMSRSEADLRSLSPTEFSAGRTYEFDAVPTGIALRDGRIYLALFGGFPFIAGSGQVVSLPQAEDGPPLEVEFDELNSPVDLAFDKDGRLLVVEHGTYGQDAGFMPATGRLSSFDLSTGERRVLIDGLTRPVSVLVFDAREIVVSELGGALIFLRRTD